MRTIDADAFARRLDAVQSASLTPAQVVKMLGEEPTTEAVRAESGNGNRAYVFDTDDEKVFVTIMRKEKHE